MHTLSLMSTTNGRWKLLKKDAEKVGQMAVQAITEAGKVLGLRCPLAGEYKVGFNWADTH